MVAAIQSRSDLAEDNEEKVLFQFGITLLL